jgi:hypothetical protein
MSGFIAENTGGVGSFISVACDNSGNAIDSYGSSGETILLFKLSNSDERLQSVLQSDDRLVMAANNLAGDSIYVVRLKVDGTLDTAFGIGGVTALKYTGINQIEILEDNSIQIVGGRTRDTIAISVLSTDGKLRTDFGSNGYQMINFSSGVSYNDVPGYVLRSNGKFVVVQSKKVTRYTGMSLVPHISQAGGTLNANVQGAVLYEWLYNDTVQVGTGTATLHVTQLGKYSVRVSDSSGCTYVSQPFSVTSISSASEADIANSTRLYPNPVEDRLVIENVSDESSVYIADVFGRELFAGRISQNTRVISTRDYPSGHYVVMISREGSRAEYHKMLKLK